METCRQACCICGYHIYWHVWSSADQSISFFQSGVFYKWAILPILLFIVKYVLHVKIWWLASTTKLHVHMTAEFSRSMVVMFFFCTTGLLSFATLLRVHLSIWVSFMFSEFFSNEVLFVLFSLCCHFMFPSIQGLYFAVSDLLIHNMDVA